MVSLLRVTAGALGCLFIVAFQLQLLPFFSRLFVGERSVWPVIYYGCWTLVIATTLLLLILQRPLLIRVLPVLAVCVVFVFQGAWNDLLGPLIYLDRNNQFTLAVGLANMVTRKQLTAYNREWGAHRNQRAAFAAAQNETEQLLVVGDRLNADMLTLRLVAAV